MKKLILLFTLLLISAVPFTGFATVDGKTDDWLLTEDHFAVMYESGDPTNDVLSNLYLRYDCSEEVLYALVVTDYEVLELPEEAYIKLDGVKMVDGSFGNDGVAPDFEWLLFEGGYEASLPLPKGDYQLDAHVQIFPDRTSAVENRDIPLEVSCEPTAITLSSFSAKQSNVPLVIGAIVIVVMIVLGVIYRKKK